MCFLSSEVAPVEYRKQLLQTDFMVYISSALPGFIPLYIGMPVILKGRNLSTDLTITNSSKGILRHYYETVFIKFYLCERSTKNSQTV